MGAKPVRFDGRVALVTGAGSGLGRAHALHLAERGAKVVVNDLGVSLDGNGNSSSVADKVVAKIRAAGGEAVANYGSVADRAAAAGMVQTAIDSFGRLDIVVNNAGILRDKTFAKMDLDDYEFVFNVHFLGSLYVTKAAWPHMIGQNYGRIVFTSSGVGLSSGFGQSNYGAAKTAMVGLMNSLKNEGAKFNIRVNLISPVASTRMAASAARVTFDADALAPEKVSAGVAWLCSENCERTGEIVAAGGGYFAAIRFVRSKGKILRVGDAPTVDDFDAAQQEIFDFTGAAQLGRTLDPDVKKTLGIAD